MKPGVITQLYVQIVFAVEERVCFLRNKEHNEEIFKYINSSDLVGTSKKSSKTFIQEKHHKKRSFREEYIALLEKFGIEYDEKYLFRFFSRKWDSL